MAWNWPTRSLAPGRRTVTAILWTLWQAGGAVSDPDGGATRVLAEKMAANGCRITGTNLSRYLGELETDRWGGKKAVNREIYGKRCDLIQLLLDESEMPPAPKWLSQAAEEGDRQTPNDRRRKREQAFSKEFAEEFGLNTGHDEQEEETTDQVDEAEEAIEDEADEELTAPDPAHIEAGSLQGRAAVLMNMAMELMFDSAELERRLATAEALAAEQAQPDELQEQRVALLEARVDEVLGLNGTLNEENRKLRLKVKDLVAANANWQNSAENQKREIRRLASLAQRAAMDEGRVARANGDGDVERLMRQRPHQPVRVA